MKLSVTIFFIFVFSTLTAQNLFVNSSFEELNTCTEIHQQCSPEAWFNIRPVAPPRIEPNRVPRPFSGDDLLIVPVENIYKPVAGRSFIYTMFCCPLQKGANYKLSFYLHTGGLKFYGLDFCLRKKEFISGNSTADSLKSSIHISTGDIVNEYAGWKYIETGYTAKGDERFCLTGNLARDTFYFPSNQRMNKAGDMFYFIDDISFTPLQPVPLCTAFQKNKDLMYAQDLRHTEKALIDTMPFENIIVDTVTVPAVFFETDKSSLKPAFKKLIDNLVLKLKGKELISLEIEGHTDDRNTTLYNDKLSADRAQSVLNYFVMKLPAVKNIISAEGRGEKFPKADNRSEKGRAANRRVEIILTYRDKPL